jgi:hypothetical protein
MAVADGIDFPIAEAVGSASPHEVILVETMLEKTADAGKNRAFDW